MLVMKKFKADIESAPYGSEVGMTIEFYAADREAIVNKLLRAFIGEVFGNVD